MSSDNGLFGENSLANRVALITGSSRGIGAETARLFAKSGARIAITGRDDKAINRVVQEILGLGAECFGLKADATSRDELMQLREQTHRRLGPIDILAAFAGGLGDPEPLLDFTDDDWQRVTDANLKSKFLALSVFAPEMLARRSGSIILMSSAAGRLISQASALYGAAQAGTLMLMRHAAQEFGPTGVRVNAIAPSIIRNEKLERYMPREAQEKIAQFFPMRRIGEPIDVAQAALFLASDASSWVTGQTLDVNGGKVMV